MIEWNPPAPGPWQQDQAHTPASSTLVMQDLYPTGFNRGFTETFSRYGLLLDRLAMGVVNGFTYHQPQPFDMPGPDGPLSDEQIGAEIGRRTALAAETFETKRWRTDLHDWDTSWKPAAIARHRELGDVDLGSLDDAGLAAHLRDVGDQVTQVVYQHHRFNMAALLPVGDFALQAASWLHCDPTTLMALLDGWSPISGVLSSEIEPVVTAIESSPELRELVVGDGDPAARLNELRARCPEMDEYMRLAGHRVVEGFDVTSPTLNERPELALGRLAAALVADPTAAKRRSEALAAEHRASLPEERRDEFDELLGEARAVYRLRDERGIYSDITAIGLLRTAMLEVGRRAHADGRLADPELALDASLAELLELVDGRGPSNDELDERRSTRRALTLAGAPRYLGPPPPPPPPVDLLPPPLARMMSAVGFCIDGVLGQMDESTGDDTHIMGIPASSGVSEGTARVVRDIDELDRLESGDILITPTTGEAFNSMLHLVKGIVTDHGSFACHAGIVSREMGIPAVVGTVDGSHRIPDGATIRIDGTTGEVTVLM
jgi:rifampicin phosphotransferase